MSSPFEQWTDRDVVELIDAHPLAWIVSCSEEPEATPMPLLAETDADGRLTSLLGHVPKSSPMAARMAKQPRTLFLFSGPNAYVSPEAVATTRDWAPTWNFAVVQILADVELDDGLTDTALQNLIDHLERGRSLPWSTAEMGPRYDQLRQRVIGFRASIHRIKARFKLGQDERPEVFSSIADHFHGTELASWMHRFRPRGAK